MMKRFLLVSLVLLSVFVLQNICLAGPFLNLPSGLVKAEWHHPGSNSYWEVRFTDIPPGDFHIEENIWYRAWCVDQRDYISNNAKLYAIAWESYDTRLLEERISKPPKYKYMPDLNRGNTWDNPYPNPNPSDHHPNTDVHIDRLNWVINNWEAFLPTNNAGNKDISWEEAQTVIWYFMDNGQLGMLGAWNSDAKELLGAALNASVEGYVPPYLAKEAVILYIPNDQTSPIIYDLTEKSGYQYTVIEVVNPIPEPGTLLLLGSGLAGLAGYGRLRLKRRRI